MKAAGFTATYHAAEDDDDDDEAAAAAVTATATERKEERVEEEEEEEEEEEDDEEEGGKGGVQEQPQLDEAVDDDDGAGGGETKSKTALRPAPSATSAPDADAGPLPTTAELFGTDRSSLRTIAATTGDDVFRWLIQPTPSATFYDTHWQEAPHLLQRSSTRGSSGGSGGSSGSSSGSSGSSSGSSGSGGGSGGSGGGEMFKGLLSFSEFKHTIDNCELVTGEDIEMNLFQRGKVIREKK